MGLLGDKQGMMGPKASMMGQPAVQEGEAPMEGAPVEEAPAPEAGGEGDEFAGIMQGIETLQAGVQDVIGSMIDLEGQTVSDPEGIANFLKDLAVVLSKYQGQGEQPAEAPMEQAPPEA